MQQHVPVLAALALAGCSLIYNPSNLPPAPTDGGPDSMQDAEVILDSDPAALELERVSPTILFEGTGTGGSRKALLTVHGKQIVPGAKISVAVHGGGAAMLTIDDAATDVAANGFMVAAPITIAVDTNLNAGAKVRLDVTVTQPTGAGDVSKTLTALVDPAPDTPVLEIQGLDELNTANIALPTDRVHEFSQINVSGGITPADTANPLIIHARGSVTMTGATSTVNASGTAKGPGGSGGGAAGGAVGGTGGVGGGPGGGNPSGGGGGFAATGGGASGGPIAGDPQVTTLALPNRSSGGAGGNGAVAAGGAGGAGGGTIEITAGGTLIAGTLEAKGGNGASGANNGGGGSGGVVLLRSGVSVAASGINVAGGSGAGVGSVGRIRIDAPGARPTTNPVAYRGPTFAPNTPLITRQDDLVVTVLGESQRAIKYIIFNEDLSLVKGPFDQSIAGSGSNMFTLEKPLFRGLNTVCLQVEAGDIANDTRNCIQIVYLFTPE